jgi:hypothetical protein
MIFVMLPMILFLMYLLSEIDVDAVFSEVFEYGVGAEGFGGSGELYWRLGLYVLDKVDVVVGQAFTDSADAPRGTFITDLGNLLDQGIQVLIYHG